MYIPYETIGNLPFFNKFKDKFYDLKVRQNLEYIAENYKKVQKRLQKKSKKGPLKVVFYVYDDTKWKCQSLYDLLDEDKAFEVEILVTKNAAKNKDNPSYQTIEDVKKTYEFFANKKMNVKYAYDIKHNRFIPFENFNPDIIIYQHPWYVETSQGPVVCSKFAMTCYVPYYVGNTTSEIEYGLRFHAYVHKHFVLNECVKEYFLSKPLLNPNNLSVVGHPTLDYYILNKSVESNKKYVIYAPHWSINDKRLELSTFKWSGKYILEYAQKHPEINWLFKPHPLLKHRLLTENIMNKDEVEKYWSDWANIGQVCESGDYFKYFNNSKVMITDSASFLVEYFPTKQPVIHLMTEISKNCWTPDVTKLINTYYPANNLEELKSQLKNIFEDNNDYKQHFRSKILSELDYCNQTLSAKRVIDEIKQF